MAVHGKQTKKKKILALSHKENVLFSPPQILYLHQTDHLYKNVQMNKDKKGAFRNVEVFVSLFICISFYKSHTQFFRLMTMSIGNKAKQYQQ